MVLFPCCKINLGLHVISKRNDGFHDLETCFYPVPWTDILEVIPAAHLQFSFSGIPIAGDPTDNLCVRAYSLFKKEFDLPPVRLHLHKVIPAGAGLGGGSSDAASTLVILNEIFALRLDNEKLRLYAAMLGSDAAFFVDPQPMFGSGKGEILEPQPLSLSGKFLLVVCPEIHSSTAEAYRHIIPGPPTRSLRNVLDGPLSEWKTSLVNDFEPYLFRQHPTLSELREKLYRLGALFAGLSGSGSALFGVFNKVPDYQRAFTGIKVWSGTLT